MDVSDEKVEEFYQEVKRNHDSPMIENIFDCTRLRNLNL